MATAIAGTLDGLFVGEGFGTFDPETLDAVVGGSVDARLVGVTSYARELTDRFARTEVEKSGRGSRSRMVT